MDISEAHVSRGEAEGALGVIEPEDVEHGGVEVMDLDLVLDRLVSPVVGAAIGKPRFDAAAGHPGGEAEGVVVATVAALGEGGAAKFAGPDHERFVEQSELFEVGDEGSDRLVDGLAVLVVPVDEIIVLVPAIAISPGAGEFDEADATLDEAAGEEALAAEDLGLIEVGLEAVHFLHAVRFTAEVHQFGNGGLHAESGFVVQDGGLDLFFAGETFLGGEVELAHEVEFASLQVEAGTGRFDVGDRGVAGIEDRALVGCGEEAGIEVIESPRGDQSAVEDNESGEVLVFGAEAIPHPGAHAGAALQARSGVEEVVRRGVLGELGGHRLDESEVVGHGGEVGEKVADPGPGFAVLFEGPRGLHDLADVVELGRFELADGLAWVLAIVFLEQRFVVEGVDVGRSAVHVEKDDVLGPGRVVGLFRGEGAAGLGRFL